MQKSVKLLRVSKAHDSETTVETSNVRSCQIRHMMLKMELSIGPTTPLYDLMKLAKIRKACTSRVVLTLLQKIL